MFVIKNKISKLIFTLFLLGCSGPGFLANSAIDYNNRMLSKIRINESKDSAFSRLYYSGIIFSEAFFPTKNNIIVSPVGSDLILKDDKKYETWFFYTKFQKKDGKASRDETTPYVFLNDKFFGKGWKTYDSISAK